MKIQSNNNIDENGYTPLAGPYRKHEKDQMNAVITHLNQGFIKYIVKDTDNGMEVWRSSKGFKLAFDERNKREYHS